MRKNEFESGWENLDHHPDITQRPRPMFDAKGNPVETAPEPEPLTAAERAMFAAVEAGVEPGRAVATGVDEAEAKRAKIVELARGGVTKEPLPHPMDSFAHTIPSLRSDTPIKIERVTPVTMTPMTESHKAVKIRELATAALDSPSPAAWAVALSEILRELDA